MALKKCKECGKEVSTKAESCPNCGAVLKKKPTKFGCGGLLLLIIIIAIFGSIVGNFTDDSSKNKSKSTSEVSKPKTPEEIRKDRIERAFSGWDGSHRELTKVIKESMHDPDSYDHEETVYADKGAHLIVKTTFRGKNAFGGVVKNSVTAKVSLDGQVLEIISQ